MNGLRWVDRTQPQTLMIATIVMYINGFLGLLGLMGLGTVSGFVLLLALVLTFGPIAAGLGIANEKKWGYWLGVVLTALYVAFIIVYFSASSLVNLLFAGALLALLLHPQSQEYRRTWFK
jgi:hypothetical protein